MIPRMRRLLLLLLTALAVVAAPVATPQSAKTSAASREAHEKILKAYGVYADQGLQDYINELGQRIARRSTPSPPAAATYTCTAACCCT
jgi:predicted Zn-dependent protease